MENSELWECEFIADGVVEIENEEASKREYYDKVCELLEKENIKAVKIKRTDMVFNKDNIATALITLDKYIRKGLDEKKGQFYDGEQYVGEAGEARGNDR